jgi:DNA-binding response OmpR family regulator
MTDPTGTPAIPQVRVLVVDDEASVRSALARSLTLLGYTADAAASGYQALAMLEHTPYDAMVLDIRMPGMDGIEVLQRVRQIYPDMSVILLTGHATLESAIAALRSHADDYLLKPASVRDIAAAIARALEQRVQEGPPRVISPGRFLRAGPVTLDRERHLAIMAEADGADSLRAELTVSESALLTHLMQHPHTVFSCCELAQDVLGYEVSKGEAQKIVRPHICRLRKKIEPDPDHPHLIRTVPGEGYSFAP